MVVGSGGVGHLDGEAVRRLHRLPRQGRGQAGASEDEVAEALGIAVLMDGGTASVYTPRAWGAFLEFAHSEEVGGSLTTPWRDRNGREICWFDELSRPAPAS